MIVRIGISPVELRPRLPTRDALQVILHLEDRIQLLVEADHALRLLEAALGDVLARRDDQHLAVRRLFHEQRGQAQRRDIGRFRILLRHHAQQLPDELAPGDGVLARQEGAEDRLEPVAAGLRGGS